MASSKDDFQRSLMTSLFHVSAALHSGDSLFQLGPPIPFIFQQSDPSPLQQPGLVDKSGASQETRKGPFIGNVLGGRTDCTKKHKLRGGMLGMGRFKQGGAWKCGGSQRVKGGARWKGRVGEKPHRSLP